jgi:hypothetical protein
LTVVVHQRQKSVTTIGAQPAEHAPDIHSAVLISVTDQLHRAASTSRCFGEASQVTRPEH